MGLGKAEQPVAPVEAKAKMDVVTQPFRGTSDLPLVVNGSDQRAMLQANPVIDGIKAAGADKKTDLPPAAQALVEEHGGKGKKKEAGKEEAHKGEAMPPGAQRAGGPPPPNKSAGDQAKAAESQAKLSGVSAELTALGAGKAEFALGEKEAKNPKMLQQKQQCDNNARSFLSDASSLV